MANKWTVIHDDKKAQEEERVCYYCKRFFLCRNSADTLCSGRLPQWEFLAFLMRKINPGDRCDKFVLHRVYERIVRQK